MYIHHLDLHSFPTRRSSDLQTFCARTASLISSHVNFANSNGCLLTLSLALRLLAVHLSLFHGATRQAAYEIALRQDRKSTRLNSSHQIISYAVFCLKKKNQF